MIRPRFLRKGDTVCIVAPGRKLDQESIEAAVKVIESRGLSVKLSQNLLSNRHNYLSGTDAERLDDLQRALNDPSINAVICARGGYGTTRVLDQLDFTKFIQSPKWICGFSDITALHLKIQSLNIQSIHSAMPVQLARKEHASSTESLLDVLFGRPSVLTANGSLSNRSGETSAELIGGNLSLLTDSLGTASEIQTDNKILIIEEVGEYRYRLDRMLVQLKRAGKLKNLAGLVIGYMTDIKEGELPFGETVEEIIRNHTEEFNYPIAFNLSTGHESPNLAWIAGAKGQLSVTNEKSTLSF